MKLVCALAAVWAVLLLVLSPRVAVAAADDQHCDGPDVCCPQALADHLPGQADVGIGVVVMGISDIDEREGTWNADFYLYESWTALPGFTPHTELVNEVESKGASFDSTVIEDGKCVRSRRIRSVLRVAYDLRRFPFDRQQLSLQLSDDDYDSSQVKYQPVARAIGIDPLVHDTVSGWRIESEPTLHIESRGFAWEPGARTYDYATFAIPVRRNVTFYFLKFFLPLALIVLVAFSVFWIDPDDLGSQVSVGVTCLLAAIAFQFAMGDSLPAVAYMTFSDGVYASAYLLIACAVLESVATNTLARRSHRTLSLRIDKACRWAFPALLLLGVLGAWWRAFA